MVPSIFLANRFDLTVRRAFSSIRSRCTSIVPNSDSDQQPDTCCADSSCCHYFCICNAEEKHWMVAYYAGNHSLRVHYGIRSPLSRLGTETDGAALIWECGRPKRNLLLPITLYSMGRVLLARSIASLTKHR